MHSSLPSAAAARTMPTGSGRRRLRAVVATALAAALTAGTAGVALADDIYNTIDGTTAAQGAIDAQAELMPLAVGGAAGTTTLRVQARNSSIDGFEGCNMQKGPVTFNLTSSNPAIATVEPTTVTFTACSTPTAPQERTITVAPVGAGKAQITASVASNPSVGTFRVDTATFDVEVAPPPNNPPAVSVINVVAGASYAKGGEVPSPMCRSTDVEDGTTTFAPVMSRPAPQLTDGLGERLARCTYTDSRGDTAVSSASYFIVDLEKPVVRYVLSKTRPANGWYRSEVALDWIVTEPQSPLSLTTEGCERVWITEDQSATDYTCTATSAGGTTVVTSEKLQKDATPPTVTGTVETQGVDVGGVTWYPAHPSIAWSAEDAVSGVAADSLKPTVTFASEQGRNMMARTVATDNAGNTGGTSVQYINVDASAPVVTASLVGDPAFHDGTRPWFKDAATVEVTASDPDVQPFERGSGLADDPSGLHELTASTDFVATATDRVGHTGASAAVPVAIDSQAPAVSVTCPKYSLIKGLPAKATWTATDEAGGSGLASAASGSLKLDTSTVGLRKASAPAAMDKVGHASAAAGCEYRVVYAFVGFLQPIDNFGVYNKVKAGSAVPVKFSLVGNQGMNILSGAPVVTKVACPSTMKTDSLEQTASSSSTSGLKYDSRTTLYTYTWKTATAFAGTCQKLSVNLADGTSQTALFHFTK